MKRIVWLVLGFCFFALLLFCLAANLYAQYSPSPYLGPPRLFGVYSPLDFYRWTQAPALAKDGRIDLILALWAFLCVAFFILALFVRMHLRGKLSTTLHGSSRWLTNEELKKTGLPDNKGDVVLGMRNQARYTKTGQKWQLLKSDRIIYGQKDTHIAAIAPTRSGKGISFVVPTALSWRGSMIAYDLKGELFDLTGGWRALFSKIIKFEPASRASSRFNPLDFVRKEDQVGDIDNLCAILVLSNDKDAHWTNNARQLIAGAVLYVLNHEPKEKHTLYQAYRTLNDPNRPMAQLWEAMLASPHASIQEIGRNMAGKPENEFGSILSTANTALRVFADPIVQSNTCASDFSVKELMFGAAPVSLYLVIKPTDSDRLAPLTRIFFDFVAKQLISLVNPAAPDYKHRMLLLIDEFTSLGRMEFFETMLAYFAGYGIRCAFIFQSFAQLYKVYGRETSILGNCHVKIILGAADINDAKLVSEYLGKATVKNLSKSESVRLTGGDSQSHSTSVTGRNLMTPDEVLTMPFDRIVILQIGRLPYLAKKIMYYMDSRFAPRAGLKPPALRAAEVLPQIEARMQPLALPKPIAQNLPPAGALALAQPAANLSQPEEQEPFEEELPTEEEAAGGFSLEELIRMEEEH